MANSKNTLGRKLSDDALDQVVGGKGVQDSLLQAYPELESKPALAQEDKELLDAWGDIGTDLPIGRLERRAQPRLDERAEFRQDLDHSVFSEKAQDTFMQVWNDGDGEMDEQEAFQCAADVLREMMEDAGIAMENFETDIEMALEVFNDALEDGEDPNDAFEIACQSFDEANRDNFASPTGFN